MEQTSDATTAKLLPAPVLSLLMATRQQLNASLRPEMKPTSFNNWLQRAMKDRDFPAPVRTGRRSVSWLVSEVQAWVASQPRKGVFAGRRKKTTPAPETA